MFTKCETCNGSGIVSRQVEVPAPVITEAEARTSLACVVAYLRQEAKTDGHLWDPEAVVGIRPLGISWATELLAAVGEPFNRP